jgi:hypothetical protein
MLLCKVSCLCSETSFGVLLGTTLGVSKISQTLLLYTTAQHSPAHRNTHFLCTFHCLMFTTHRGLHLLQMLLLVTATTLAATAAVAVSAPRSPNLNGIISSSVY